MQEKKLKELYTTLLDHFGRQDWWPARTRFEVVVGAILTQNTSWENVERVIEDLHNQKLLNPRALDEIPVEELAPLLKRSGYFNQKAKKLKAFLDYFRRYDFSFEQLMKKDKDVLREELLSIWGIGPETADDILLYALDKPSFVIDAYTKRILKRMGMVKDTASYDELKYLFEESGRNKANSKLETFREYHALLDELAKQHCKTAPLCGSCPVSDLCSKNI
jgi:endonuclease-3 related protein